MSDTIVASKLNVIFTPTNTTDDTTIQWNTNRSSVVATNKNGELFTRGLGIAVITATHVISGLKSTCTVTVIE